MDWDHVQALQPAIQEVVNRHDDGQGVVVRYVLIAEIMEPDGTKNLQTYRGPTAEAIPIWDVRGWLLDRAMDREIFGDDDDG